MKRGTLPKYAGTVLAAGLVLAICSIRCPAAEEVIRFDPAKAEVTRDGGQWKIVSDGVLVKSFTTEQAARQAMDIIRFYKMDSRRILGSMEFFLVNDRSPVGSMKEEDSYAFNTDKVEASKQTNAGSPEKGGKAFSSWKVIEGDKWMLDFGDNEEQARVAATLIQKYRFSHMAYAGKPARQMMYFYADAKGSEKGSVAPPVVVTPIAPPTVPATPTLPPSMPAVKGGKAQLTVRVFEGVSTPARDPAVTVRPVKQGASQARSENPATFTLEPGEYEVTAHVGSSADLPPRRIVLQPGQAMELALRTGTGTLELKFTAGNKPIGAIGVVQLRAGGKVVAALSETVAKFQAPEGPYTLRVGLGSNQHLDIEGLSIDAGKTSSHTIDVPCALVSVQVKGRQYAQGKRPYIQVDAGGKMVAALMEIPSRFQLLAGRYCVFVQEDGKKRGLKYIDVKPGENMDVTLDVDAPNQEPPKAQEDKPWPAKAAATDADKTLSKNVIVCSSGGKLTAMAPGEQKPRLVVPGEYILKSRTILEATLSPVDIFLPSGGRISLDANTRICVGLYDNGIAVAQQTGKTWHAVRRPEQGEFFYTVVTPRVRFTAVGTDFGVALTPGSSYVCTYTGTVVPRGTYTESDGATVPVYEWVPGGILCQPPPESSYWTQQPTGCVVDGKLVPVVEITDPHTGEPISSTSDAVPSGLSCGTPSAGIGGSMGASIGAGRGGTFTYTQENRLTPVDGSAPVDSIQRLSYYGVKPDIGMLTGRDSWADRNSRLTRDAAALERAHREGRLSDAAYRQKLRELYERGRALAADAPPIRFDPHGPHRVAVEGLRHVQNRIHSMRPDDDYYKFWDNKLPDGVAGYDTFVNSIGDDGIVSDAQWPYAIRLMRAMGVPFVGE